MKPINRVAEIIQDKELSVSHFERQINSANGTISAAIRKESSLKDEMLNKILEVFPEYNAEWLLTGEGEKYKSLEKNRITKEVTINENMRFEEVVAGEVVKMLEPFLSEFQKIHHTNSTRIHSMENLLKRITVKIDHIERTTKNTYEIFKK